MTQASRRVNDYWAHAEARLRAALSLLQSTQSSACGAVVGFAGPDMPLLVRGVGLGADRAVLISHQLLRVESCDRYVVEVEGAALCCAATPIAGDAVSGFVALLGAESEVWAEAALAAVDQVACLLGTGMGGFASAGHDADRLRFAERALQRQEARYLALMNAAGEGVVVQSAGGAIIEANDEACRILALSEDQLYGRTSLDPRWRALDQTGRPLKGEHHPAMIALSSGRAVRDFVMGVDAPGAGRRWILVNATPVWESAGAPSAVVATFRAAPLAPRVS